MYVLLIAVATCIGFTINSSCSADEDDAEGIEETLSDSPSMGRGIFNLQGQRINGLQKGLNIQDGKKVWVK